MSGGYGPEPLDVLRRIWKSGKRQEGDPPHLSGATAMERAVLSAIVIRGDNDRSWRCAMSLSTIGKDTGMSRRQVSRTLARLEERGLIRRTSRRESRMVTVYELTDALTRDTPSLVTHGPQPARATEAQSRDTQSHELPATAGNSAIGEELSRAREGGCAREDGGVDASTATPELVTVPDDAADVWEGEL